jgi:hypothetical protein
VPWHSRHKARRERAALIAILLAFGIAFTAMIAMNTELIGRFFVIFTPPHG